MILPSPSAPEGSVLHLDRYSPSDFSPTSAILCRNTAPLVSFAFGLIRRSVGCRVLGREIGQGLVSLIKKLNAPNLDLLSIKLEMYEQRETEKFERKGELQSAESVRDRVSCINIFLSASSSIEDLCLRITNLFDDNSKGLLTLSTVHKAKGLEWPKVFILDKPKLMPSKFARLPWQIAQEINLIYVAITRAKLDLVYIDSDKWKSDDREEAKALDFITQQETLALAMED